MYDIYEKFIYKYKSQKSICAIESCELMYCTIKRKKDEFNAQYTYFTILYLQLLYLIYKIPN